VLFLFLYLSNLAPLSTEHIQCISAMLPPRVQWRSMKLTAHSHLVPRLRLYRDAHMLPLSHVPSWYGAYYEEQTGMTLYLSTFSMMWWMTFNEHDVNSPLYFSFIILSLTVTLFSGSSTFVSMRWFYFPNPACMLYLFSVI